ncbi:MAG TPA: neutral zinc metallopeptidase [Gemmatimonadaceae bacterium]|nr:neutral zinc metallopeptidase [Gemmatimonadaceae bacterium]
MRPTAAIRGGLVALALAVSGSRLNAEPIPTSPPTIDVTEQEVDASNQKIWAVYNALVAMWSADFKQVGEKFSPPGVARYRMRIRTPCGYLMPENAEYCAANNTIYFDDVFVAAQVKDAAQALGTDGDMAGLGIIAHEMGHAVAMQLGHASRQSYENEATADCLAGAFTLHAKGDGSLEQGDVEEAEFGLSSAGDPTPRLTGNGRVDQRTLARMERVGHGNSEQRVQNFRNGLQSGAGACLEEFRGLRT